MGSVAALLALVAIIVGAKATSLIVSNPTAPQLTPAE
jgi:hypothetical protein